MRDGVDASTELPRDRLARAARELAGLRAAPGREALPIGIVVPVYNDWEAFRHLVQAIEAVCEAQNLTAEVIVVDDGSWQSGDETLRTIGDTAPRIHLRCATLVTNLGHQRAIAVGLTVAHAHAASYRAVIVMDGDGEDRPEHIPYLLETSAAHPDAIVCVRRGRRFEGARFALGYGLFKAFFLLGTGKTIDFGHYCVIPPRALARLVHSPALWSHFAATLLRSGLPLHRVRLDRGRRYAGRSSMNLTGLIRHGLNAIAVFEDVCLVRLLIALGLFSGGLVAALIAVVAIRFCTDMAVPGWATSAAGLLLVALLQAALLALASAAAHLNRRSLSEVVPAREAERFLVPRADPAQRMSHPVRQAAPEEAAPDEAPSQAATREEARWKAAS
ncbi:Undecaprenyl-phosphate 4-deoxy-4-formamido-L-arabinose transferase [Methylobacterium gregans]|uniref:Undecaprenyl-phosphate 4-deoxy-4-formamido-L-arabinose transferase n=2 Tax=Methylobacterium gregans TaxID=374424 RepID=A0AA37MD55_9HYPH|nr:Undecaprenyl-phosphate 4-deoxy-4-formamido-L-arabinose transferase [Methylobacterium gregans]